MEELLICTGKQKGRRQFVSTSGLRCSLEAYEGVKGDVCWMSNIEHKDGVTRERTNYHGNFQDAMWKLKVEVNAIMERYTTEMERKGRNNFAKLNNFSTEEDCQKYLKQLARSPFAYHLDDNVNECFQDQYNFPDEATRELMEENWKWILFNWNYDAAMGFLRVHNSST